MRRAWLFLITILVLVWLASAAGAPLTEALVTVDSSGADPTKSLGLREDICARKDAVDVGIPGYLDLDGHDPGPEWRLGGTVAAKTKTGYEGSLTNLVKVVTREGVGGQRVTVSTVTALGRAVFLPVLLRHH